MPASAHGLLVAEGSAIRSLADIKGKKIAFARGTSAHLVTLRLLAKAGLTYNDIVPVYLPPADGAKALVGGSVDAWVVWDPFLALAQSRQKVRVIATTKDIVNGNSVYVANPDFAAKHPRALAAVMEEVKRVTEWAAQNRDQFAEKLAAAIGIDRDVERLAVGRTDLVVGPITPTIVAQLQETADAFEKLRLIPEPVDIRSAVWSSPGN